MKVKEIIFPFLIVILLATQGMYAQWVQTKGPLGGGAFSLAINSKGYIFAGTVGNGVSRSTDNGDNWQQINTGLVTSGYVSSLAINISGHIFAGISGGVGGIFYSTDNGNNWFQTGFANNIEVRSLAINTNGYIFAGTFSGLFRSTDEGNSWKSLKLSNTLFSCIAINSSGNIFASTGNGMYRSTDNGDNWQQIDTGLTKGVSSLAINYSGYIFAGTGGSGVYVSTNNGDDWQQINTGLPDNSSVYSLAINNSGNVFAGIYSEEAPGIQSPAGSGLFRSTDNGDSWQKTDLTNDYVPSLAINNSGQIFAGTGTGVEGGVFRSIDNGNNWTLVGLNNSVVLSLEVNNNGNIFAGSAIGVFRSTDNGTDWQNMGLTNFQIYALTINSSGHVFAGTRDGGIYRSTNNGDSWQPINTGLTNTSVASVTSLAINSKGHIFAASDGKAFRSTDNGDSWQQINTGLPNSSVASVYSLAINTSDQVFVGTWGGGVYRSTDSGDNWQQINTGLTSSIVISFAINGNGDIFAGTDISGVFRSTDNGDNWQYTGLKGDQIYSIAVTNNGYIIAGTSGAGVFKSTDNGASWAQINEGLTNLNIYPLVINNVTGNIFLGTWGSMVWQRPLNEMIPSSSIILISPGNGFSPGYTISTLSPLFLWNKITSASIYGLQLYKFNNSAYELIYNNDDITNNSITLPAGTLSGGQYYWQVRTNVNNSWTDYSLPYYFNVSVTALTPIILLSSSSVQTGEDIVFSGINFSINNQAKAIITSDNGFDTTITITTNSIGYLTNSVSFTTPGIYNIYCIDLGTGNLSNSKSFEVNGTTISYFNIISPNSGYKANVNESISVKWQDNLTLGSGYPVVGSERGYNYFIEISSNSGTNWQVIDTVSGFYDIDNIKTFSTVVTIANASSNYLIRVRDGFVSNRTTANIPIQILSAAASNLTADFLWDHSYNTNSGQPIGVVTDGTSRFYIRVSDPGNTISQVTFALFDSVDNNNETRTLGKLMRATNITKYDTEANSANQLSAVITQPQVNNEFWCWYVAPDDFVGSNPLESNLPTRDVFVRITAQYSDGSTKQIKKTITVERPPVVLVHGLDSDIKMWVSYDNSSLFSKFRYYKLTIGAQDSYNNNASLILSQSGSSAFSIPGVIKEFRESRFACNQVYYVGHSMG
ncbi:MAG: hypothetical protein ACYC49_04380 [Ignavibacteriaceae bacterium]